MRQGAGLKISGMAIAGLPGIVIGRTPHHVWSMQVGQAHTVDYYFEPAPGALPSGYYSSRQETIPVAGGIPVTLTVYRTPHGPVVNPMNFNPATYDAAIDGPIVAWPGPKAWTNSGRRCGMWDSASISAMLTITATSLTGCRAWTRSDRLRTGTVSLWTGGFPRACSAPRPNGVRI